MSGTKFVLPTVVVSAAIDDDFLAMYRGVRCMPKPFDPTELSQAVLSEIRLGRMDERVPIHLLNPLVESMRATLLGDMHIGADALYDTSFDRKVGALAHRDLWRTSSRRRHYRYGFE